jgi:hypothetical protein
LLQDKEGDDLAEVKSLLLQVDQALGSSQCLLMGTLVNFQTGSVFPIKVAWISKSLLLKLPGKELAPNPEKEEP